MRLIWHYEVRCLEYCGTFAATAPHLGSRLPIDPLCRYMSRLRIEGQSGVSHCSLLLDHQSSVYHCTMSFTDRIRRSDMCRVHNVTNSILPKPGPRQNWPLVELLTVTPGPHLPIGKELATSLNRLYGSFIYHYVKPFSVTSFSSCASLPRPHNAALRGRCGQ